MTRVEEGNGERKARSQLGIFRNTLASLSRRFLRPLAAPSCGDRRLEKLGATEVGTFGFFGAWTFRKYRGSLISSKITSPLHKFRLLSQFLYSAKSSIKILLKPVRSDLAISADHPLRTLEQAFFSPRKFLKADPWMPASTCQLAFNFAPGVVCPVPRERIN